MGLAFLQAFLEMRDERNWWGRYNELVRDGGAVEVLNRVGDHEEEAEDDALSCESFAFPPSGLSPSHSRMKTKVHTTSDMT